MKIYVPVYENGKRDAIEIESTQSRLIRRPGGGTILYYGRCYCASLIFDNRDDAFNAWNKRWNPSALNPNNIEWRMVVDCA